MKKDKKWLKEQNNYLKEAVGKPAINDFSRGLNDAYDTLESLIDQLDEPEITEEQALNKLAESYPFSADGINAILQAQLAGYSPLSTMRFIQSKEPELFAEEVPNE